MPRNDEMIETGAPMQDSEDLILRPDKGGRHGFGSTIIAPGWSCLQTFNLDPKVSNNERDRAGRICRHLVVHVPKTALIERMEPNPKNLHFRFYARRISSKERPEITRPRSLAEIRTAVRDDVSAQELVWSSTFLVALERYGLTQGQFSALAEKAAEWLRPYAKAHNVHVVW